MPKVGLEDLYKGAVAGANWTMNKQNVEDVGDEIVHFISHAYGCQDYVNLWACSVRLAQYAPVGYMPPVPNGPCVPVSTGLSGYDEKALENFLSVYTQHSSIAMSATGVLALWTATEHFAQHAVNCKHYQIMFFIPPFLNYLKGTPIMANQQNTSYPGIGSLGSLGNSMYAPSQKQQVPQPAIAVQSVQQTPVAPAPDPIEAARNAMFIAAMNGLLASGNHITDAYGLAKHAFSITELGMKRLYPDSDSSNPYGAP
jgi:hypothetical protein